jgi:hypothetical protein
MNDVHVRVSTAEAQQKQQQQQRHTLSVPSAAGSPAGTPTQGGRTYIQSLVGGTCRAALPTPTPLPNVNGLIEQVHYRFPMSK